MAFVLNGTPYQVKYFQGETVGHTTIVYQLAVVKNGTAEEQKLFIEAEFDKQKAAILPDFHVLLADINYLMHNMISVAQTRTMTDTRITFSSIKGAVEATVSANRLGKVSFHHYFAK